MRTSDAPPPFFSVVISTYNRRQVVTRCVESCLRQTFPSFEVVVVDDGSTDGTREALEARDDPKIRVVAHGENRGINPSRHTGVTHSRGEWLVVVDSDWELYPHSLQRLHDIIGGLPDGIRVVRSRLQWDDGHISPSFVPDAPIGYEERIRWVEEEGGDDAARCLHRDVFRSTPYISDRRGAMEALYELNLARNERARCTWRTCWAWSTPMPPIAIYGAARGARWCPASSARRRTCAGWPRPPSRSTGPLSASTDLASS